MLKYSYHKVLPAKKHDTAHLLCKIKCQQNIVNICETAALTLVITKYGKIAENQFLEESEYLNFAPQVTHKVPLYCDLAESKQEDFKVTGLN